MKDAMANQPIEDFPNVVPLEKVALTRTVKVDTPDNAPTESGEEPPEPAPAPGAANPKNPPGNTPPSPPQN
jgi:hypothetical protein